MTGLDLHAILTTTDPAATRADALERAEVRDGLHRVLRAYEARVCWPSGRPDRIRFRNALLELLRSYEALHEQDHLIPTRAAHRPRTRNEAA